MRPTLYQGDCRLNRGGLSHQALADMYGVGRTTITNVLLRNTGVQGVCHPAPMDY